MWLHVIAIVHNMTEIVISLKYPLSPQLQDLFGMFVDSVGCLWVRQVGKAAIICYAWTKLVKLNW